SFEPAAGNACVLGEMAASLTGTVRPGERCVVVGWELTRDGRRHHTGTALFAEDGTRLGVARATWFEVPAPSDGAAPLAAQRSTHDEPLAHGPLPHGGEAARDGGGFRRHARGRCDVRLLRRALPRRTACRAAAALPGEGGAGPRLAVGHRAAHPRRGMGLAPTRQAGG